MEDILVIVFVQAVICAILAAIIANGKNAGCLGCVVGFLLGPIGVIVACLIDGRPQCPKCSERVQSGAAICPHCSLNLRWSNDGTPIPRIQRSIAARDSQSDAWPGVFDLPLPPVGGRDSQAHDSQATTRQDDLDDLVVDQFLQPPSPEKNPPLR